MAIKVTAKVDTLRELLDVAGIKNREVADHLGMHTTYFANRVANGGLFHHHLVSIVELINMESRITTTVSVTQLVSLIGEEKVKIRGTLAGRRK